MENNGWIKLFRKFREWGWYKDNNTKSLWLEILLTANYEDKEWQGIPVKRGQLITSVSHLSKNLDISIKSIRTSLNHLKSTNEVAIQTTPQYTLITVNKYNDYQEVANEMANEGQTKGKRLATTKEIKKERNKDIYIMSSKNLQKFISKWNEVYKTNFRSTKLIEKPLNEWLKTYSIDDICNSIDGIKNDPYWKDKDLEPLWLLRTRDKTGDIDRIGKFLNTKPVIKYQTHL